MSVVLFFNSYLNLKSSLFLKSQVIKTDTRSSSVSWRRISNQPSCQTRLFLSTVLPYHLLSLYANYLQGRTVKATFQKVLRFHKVKFRLED